MVMDLQVTELLATKGMATIYFMDANVGYISGSNMT